MQGPDSIRHSLRACGRGLAAAGFFSLALNLLMLSVPLYMMSVYDRVLTSRSNETLLMLTIIAVGALAVVGVLEAVRQLTLARTGARLETALGAPILAVSLRGAAQSGSDVQGLRDLAQLRQFIASPLVVALLDMPMAPIFLGLVYLIHPQLGWLSVAAAILILLIAAANQRLTRDPLDEAAHFSSAALAKAQCHVRNAELVRAMGMFSASVSSWGADNAKALGASDRAASRNAMVNGASHFLRLFLQIAILGYGAYLVLSDSTLSAGIIFAASMISARALGPLGNAIGGWKAMVSANQSWKRIRSLLHHEQDGAAITMVLPAPEASLLVERVIYQPAPSALPILKGISFSIEPGEIVGIIGPSGAGKSTLARILVGAVAPSSGTVRIGGGDLANWQPEALGPYIGYVPQDVEMFPGTVAQNIARMTEMPDPEKVVSAARLANCDELIQHLQKGYDTILGAAGHVLSGGERQRIALARAFYGSPRIVVLDEPNASLDGAGEEALIVALRKARDAGITCVVVSQRTSVVPALSKLMVLRDGRIEAFGPTEQVLQSQIRSAPQDSSLPRPDSAVHTAPFSITARFG